MYIYIPWAFKTRSLNSQRTHSLWTRKLHSRSLVWSWQRAVELKGMKQPMAWRSLEFPSLATCSAAVTHISFLKTYLCVCIAAKTPSIALHNTQCLLVCPGTLVLRALTWLDISVKCLDISSVLFLPHPEGFHQHLPNHGCIEQQRILRALQSMSTCPKRLNKVHFNLSFLFLVCFRVFFFSVSKPNANQNSPFTYF